MWPDSGARQAELQNKADYFEAADYPLTAEWIRQLAMDLGSKHSLSYLNAILSDTDTTWRSEYVNRDEVRKKRLDTIWKLLLDSVGSIASPEDLQSLQPVMLDLVENAKNIGTIAEVFKPVIGITKMRFFGMSMIYLLNAEGIFDQALRVIFGLFRLTKSEPLPPADLNEIELSAIRTELEKAGISTDVLFDGYDNHVRNSIAHSRFRYDEKSVTMTFTDYNKYTKQRVVKPFTIYDFSKLVIKLDDVSHLLLTIIFMFRIHQLVLLAEVPRPGEDLIPLTSGT